MRYLDKDWLLDCHTAWHSELLSYLIKLKVNGACHLEMAT